MPPWVPIASRLPSGDHCTKTTISYIYQTRNSPPLTCQWSCAVRLQSSESATFYISRDIVKQNDIRILMRMAISEDSDNMGSLCGVGIWLQIDNNEIFELKALRCRFLRERRDKGLSAYFLSQRLKTHSYLACANNVYIPDHNLRR